MSTDTPWSTPLPSPHEGGLPQRPARPEITADAIAFGVLTAAGVVLAFAVGALWRASAPAVLGVLSQGNPYLSAPEGKTFIARDGWFALYACIAAILLAVFAFFRYRRKGGTGAALGLALGGYASSYLASWFGKFIGPGRGHLDRVLHGLPDGSTFELPFRVRATGVIWLWPAVAVGLFFFLILLFGPSEPEAGPEPFAEPFAEAGPAQNGHLPGVQPPYGQQPNEHLSNGQSPHEPQQTDDEASRPAPSDPPPPPSGP
jgi:hypothetical protein